MRWCGSENMSPTTACAAMGLIRRHAISCSEKRPRVGGAAAASRDGETAVDAAVRLCAHLAGGVLPIQGPPGAGKTFTGARMICELVRRGKKVGITANSHKVIRNLIDAAIKAADELRIELHAARRPTRSKTRSTASRSLRATKICSPRLGGAVNRSAAARPGCGRGRTRSRRSTCCSWTRPRRCRWPMCWRCRRRRRQWC